MYVTDEEIGCPTNANNLARFILNLTVKKDADLGIYHFTDGEAMTWFSFAKLIINENNFGESVRVANDGNYRTFVKRRKHSILK